MTGQDRFAVIDIGSNSIRLVVYGAPLRAPVILFNEKVMAGLGRGVSANGRLSDDAMAAALIALQRFALLCAEMGAGTPLTVATAAVRQASNGEAFLAQIRACGLDVRLLSGAEEAEAAGRGVIAGFDNADGIVGDLGGGSLELVRVSGGAIGKRASFPLGVLRIAALRAKSKAAFERQVFEQLKAEGWLGAGQGLPFYLVGGSWRALARIHMHLTHYPLPILHHYAMPPQAATRLVRAVSRIDRVTMKGLGIISSARQPALGDAAAMLSSLVHALQPDRLVVSATGLREGLLYDQLPPAVRAEDPLIVSARAEGARQGRFAEHGDVLSRWIAPLFVGESAEQARLRHVACLLGDIGWAANPDFRAERGLEMALHGNWLAMTSQGRALVGQALFAAFGGGSVRPEILAKLASGDDLDRARVWGLAIRLGQRLGGGVEGPLAHSRLTVSDGRLTLMLNPAIAALGGEAVERRLRQLANALGLAPSLKTAP
jgi:exopolyphosphatase/guanosine-5'-triphosphate,3'-diphosphate pyrophosphatase